MGLHRIHRTAIKTCDFCQSRVRSGVTMQCSHFFCTRCFLNRPSNLITKMISDSDCLIPFCNGISTLQKTAKRQTIRGGCSLCGRLTLKEDLLLDFNQCDHSLCRWCVTAHFQLYKNKERCPLFKCLGGIPQSDQKRQKDKDNILAQNLCMNPECGGSVHMKSNPRCLKTCPSNYCDACIDESIFIKSKLLGECKGCEINSSWLVEIRKQGNWKKCSLCNKKILNLSVEMAKCKHPLHFSCKNKIIAKALHEKRSLVSCPFEGCKSKVSIKQ